MKFPVLLLSSLVLGAGLAAQTSSPALRINNEPYLVVSTTKDPNTGRSYLWPPSLNPEYSATATTGVPAGTKLNRWFPREVFRTQRSTGNPARMMLQGVRYPIATSGGTSTFPYNGYVPETRFTKAKLTSGQANQTWAKGRQMTADNTAAATFITLPETTQSFGGAGYFIVTRTLSTTVKFEDASGNHVDEFGMSIKWKGNEHRTINGSQGFFASYADGIQGQRTIQFEDPAGALSNITTDFAVTWLQPIFEDGELLLYVGSDWGYRRTASVANTITGQSVATGLSDLATTAGQFRIRTDGGTATAGDNVVFLMDFGQIFPTAINIPLLGGFDLRINPGAPTFSALLSYGGASNTNGQYWNGAWLQFASLGASSIGTTFGFQAVSVNTQTLKAVSSNAYYIEIDR